MPTEYLDSNGLSTLWGQIKAADNVVSNANNTIHEYYKLPTLTASTDTNYNILTSKSAVTIEQGGTGATSASAARTNLGITPANIGAATSGHNHNGTYVRINGTDAMTGTLTGTHFVAIDNSTTTSAGTFQVQTDIRAWPFQCYNSSGNNRASIAVDPTNNFYFVEQNPNVTPTNDGAGRENYSLPSPTNTGTTYQDYNILTTKNVISIPQGGTGATTASAARTNLEITPANIGAATSGHNHDSTYLKLSGGTLTGSIITSGSYNTTAGYYYVITDSASYWGYRFNSSAGKNRAAIALSGSNNFYFIQQNKNITADANNTGREDFELPVPTSTTAVTKTYQILTTKITGTYTTDLGTATTVANKAWTQIGSITLSEGTYIIHAHGAFPNNSTGYRAIALNTTTNAAQMDRFSLARQAPANGDTTELNFTKIQPVSESTTYYLNAYQTSGSSLSVTGGLRAIRII